MSVIRTIRVWIDLLTLRSGNIIFFSKLLCAGHRQSKLEIYPSLLMIRFILKEGVKIQPPDKRDLEQRLQKRGQFNERKHDELGLKYFSGNFAC